MKQEREAYEIPETQSENNLLPANAAKRRWELGRKTSWALRAGLVGGLALGGGVYWAHENPDQATQLSRGVIGQKWTVKLEEKGLYLQDQFDRLKFKVLGGDISPFDNQHMDPSLIVSSSPIYEEFVLPVDVPVVVEPPKPKPAPLIIPETTLLQAPVEGEGVWTTEGLPHTSPEDTLMVKTFLRPDPARPFARVDILLIDKRRIRLNMVGGTEQPGIQRGIKGPGIIPEQDKPNLLAAWNGGFQGDHASWGMYANGREYKALQKGFASIVVMADGTIKIGTWGQGELISRTDDMVAVRQNAVLLVDNCELTRDAVEKGEDPNTWGRFLADSPVFITSRSAVGLTKNGDLLVAVGNSISAKNLARTLKAAGVCWAIQLDINEEWVSAALYFPQEDGTIKAVKLSDKTSPNQNQYVDREPETRDFMYVTLDEANFKP